MRLLATKINHDYNSEAKVFATLLRHRADRYDVATVYNCWTGASQGAEEFERYSGTEIWRIDTGWRPIFDGKRSFGTKLRFSARVQASLPEIYRRARRFAPDVVYSCQQKWDCIIATE